MITIKEDVLIEIKTLVEKVTATHLSRFGDDKDFKISEELYEQVLEEMEIPTLADRKLKKVLESCTADELCQIQALMWLGRDTFENSDEASLEISYLKHYEHAKKNITKHDVQYVLSKGELLSRYLFRGMLLMNVA